MKIKQLLYRKTTKGWNITALGILSHDPRKRTPPLCYIPKKQVTDEASWNRLWSSYQPSSLLIWDSHANLRCNICWKYALKPNMWFCFLDISLLFMGKIVVFKHDIWFIIITINQQSLEYKIVWGICNEIGYKETYHTSTSFPKLPRS